MAAEIELKLFFPKSAREALISLLNSLPHSESKGVKHLSNSYFDTPDLQLRQWDMGLRIRGCDGHYEQTIKTAGSVEGGVHSRPEYNIDIDQPKVDLSRFPSKIWPLGADIDKVQRRLTSLFDTDFSRMIWHIYLQDSLVEVALDIGTVCANGVSEPICEIEFELLAGQTQALLILGEQVTKQIPARLGRASKAQRGYCLAAMASPPPLEPLDVIALGDNATPKQALLTVLSIGLERWQLLEALVLESSESVEQSELAYRLRACIRLLRSTLMQFGLLDESLLQAFSRLEQHLAPVDLSLGYRTLLTQRATLLTTLPQVEVVEPLITEALAALDLPSMMQTMLADNAYGHLQLKLVNLLFACREGLLPLNLSSELVQFADHQLEDSWRQMCTMMSAERTWNCDDLLSLGKALEESHLVGIAYGDLYRVKLRSLFCAPWNDLAQGVRTLYAYQCLAKLATAQGIALQPWLDSQQQSLLVAMEHSRRSALKATPFWR